MMLGNDMAFPATTWHERGNMGLTKRELYAMAAMQGLLSNNVSTWTAPVEEGCAKEAIAFADALLTELAKGGSNV